MTEPERRTILALAEHLLEILPPALQTTLSRTVLAEVVGVERIAVLIAGNTGDDLYFLSLIAGRFVRLRTTTRGQRASQQKGDKLEQSAGVQLGR